MKKTILLGLLLLSQLVVKSQNLDSLSSIKKDSVLLLKAKEIIMTYGPDYYREYTKPIIKKSVVIANKENPQNVNVGRIYYLVIYPYDRTKERLEMNFAAEVRIWGDTGIPMGATFGNGITILHSKTNTKSTRKQIPYQALGPIEIIDLNN